MKLARNIGKQFTTSSLSVSSIDKGSNDSMSTSENVSEDDISTSSHDNTNTIVDDLPNASEYPVFHSHGLKINDDAVRSKAVHELLKYNRGNTILYRQMSNHQGALIKIPSATSAKGYAGMKTLLPYVQSYIKNSTEVIRDLKTLHIPKGALLFSADATSMYTNIDTNLGIASIREFISTHQNELPTNFPTNFLWVRLSLARMPRSPSDITKTLQLSLHSTQTSSIIKDT